MYSHRSKRYLKLPEHRRDQQIPDAFRTTMAECIESYIGIGYGF
ncbi:hypothetical protein T01_12968 [Trichinella spiralis]|uniref:Uncharacterized protein n=1 Tax=Trichinella spiralis TaxID=6334 RepID=A0A0V0YSL7_TRISP|nr:hypothetical protein T01_12968 [Trichinella spiralis]